MKDGLATILNIKHILFHDVKIWHLLQFCSLKLNKVLPSVSIASPFLAMKFWKKKRRRWFKLDLNGEAHCHGSCSWQKSAA